MLTGENIFKGFQGTPVLKGVSLTVEKGQVVAVIGRSGSGKSTLLRCLNHLETIDRGRILIDGRVMAETDGTGAVRYAPDSELRKLCLKMGFVFQDYHLFPHFSVLHNLTQAQIHVLKRDKKKAEEKAMALLEKVGLSDKALNYPCQLSGGQCQRVAIARALAIDPEILCFDEPTSALDPQLTQEVLEVIRGLAKEKRTMIVVTHEMRFAREVADRIVFMEDGRIVEEGTPEEVMGSGRSKKLEAFMGILSTGA